MSRLLTYFIVITLFSCRGASEKAPPSTMSAFDTAKAVVEAEKSDTARPEHQSIRVEIEQISAVQFIEASKKANVSDPIVKITDFGMAQKQLADVVEFEDYGEYLGIKKINFRNGTSSGDKEEFEECSFIAYFPKEDILLCEGGHTIDVSFDLGTGQGTYEVGNPDLTTVSPNGKYRLNKVFEGQECFYHFIQKKEQTKFSKVIELGEVFENKTSKWLCVTEREFWTDDFTLYFGLVIQYKDDGNICEYYKVKIID